jgi:hypothetical protein
MVVAAEERHGGFCIIIVVVGMDSGVADAV